MKIRRPEESDALACYATFVGAVLSTPSDQSSDEDKKVWIDRVSVEILENRLKNGECWIAEEDGVIVGFCAFLPEEEELKSLYVHPDYQGLGIGKKLVESCLKRVGELGFKTINLEASPNAILFYEKIGFVDLHEPCCHLPSGSGTKMSYNLNS